MEQLRAATRDLHQEAERHPLQASLARGTVDRGTYGVYLGQLMHVHEALEGALRACPDERVRRLGAAGRSTAAAADLQSLGIDPGRLGVLAATQEVRTEVERAGMGTLVGMHYVLEGSTHGSRFVARSLRRAWGLEGAEGTRYLDPYGAEQTERWAAFCEWMNSLWLDPAATADAVTGARRMFRGIMSISEETWRSAGRNGS